MSDRTPVETPATDRRPATATPGPLFGSLTNVFRTIACTVVPEAEELDDDGWGELEAIASASLQSRPPGLARRLRALLRLIQWLPLMRHGRTFTALDPSRRADVLRYMEDHRIQLFRVGFWGLRTVILLGFYGRGEAAAAIGYRAHPRGWEALKK